MNRDNWADLLDENIRTVYHLTESGVEQMRSRIFHTETSSSDDEKDSAASGLSKLVETAEGESISYEDAKQGYDVRYIHKKFSKGIKITEEMYEDDQTNVMKKMPSALARSKVFTMEQSAADIFNHGFTAGGGGLAAFTSGDGAALFSASHTSSALPTLVQGNLTTADLDEDSLEVALVTMRATKDEKGELMLVQPDVLLVAPALEKEARILVESMQRTGTANNDINPYKGKLEVVVWDYLGTAAGGSDTAWFVLDSTQHSLNWFTRKDTGIVGPSMDDSFDNEIAKWKVSCRWSVGFSDWRGVYGSLGDNS